MTKFGVNAFNWIDDWTSEKGAAAIAEAGRLGFDFIEIPLMRPELFEFKPVKKALEKAGIWATGSTVLPRSVHMPQFPKKARKFLLMVLENLDAIGGTYLSGCIAFAGGVFTGNPPTAAERQIVADTLGDVCLEARKRGITLGLECVNRYETYLYNSLADGRETIKATRADNLQLHADTFHMNIEEENFYDSLVACADVVGYIHISESHRGQVGTGTVTWEQVFRGLKDAGYTGSLALESFSENFSGVWRAPKQTPEMLAVEGLKFMRERSEKVNL